MKIRMGLVAGVALFLGISLASAEEGGDKFPRWVFQELHDDGSYRFGAGLLVDTQTGESYSLVNLDMGEGKTQIGFMRVEKYSMTEGVPKVIKLPEPPPAPKRTTPARSSSGKRSR